MLLMRSKCHCKKIPRSATKSEGWTIFRDKTEHFDWLESSEKITKRCN